MKREQYYRMLIICFLSSLHSVHSSIKSKNSFFQISQPSLIPSRLYAGSILKESEYIQSPNGDFRAKLRSNGFFTLYRLSHQPFTKTKIWESKNKIACYNGDTDFRLSMQLDGNLVIYDKNNTVYWETATNGMGRPKQYLKLTNKGKLKLKDRINNTLWESSIFEENRNGVIVNSNEIEGGQTLDESQRLISANRKYMAMLQNDGDLGIYKIKKNRLILKWISHTKNKGFLPFRMLLSESGGLVLMDKYMRRVWSMRPDNISETHKVNFVLQNDGNLVYYVNGKIAWASNTYEK